MKTAIIIFCFNRPDAVTRLLSSLDRCIETATLPLYFYIDCARFEDEVTAVDATISVVETYKHPMKTVIYRKSNLGLKASLTNGIDDILNDHDAVIVLEDDLVIGAFALDYFLRALEKYRSQQHVVSVCGYAIGQPSKISAGSAHFLPMTHPWGWATWRDRWNEHRSGVAGMATLDSVSFRIAMNAFGLRNYRTLLWLTEHGLTNSWWIYWQLNSVNRHAISLFPTISHVLNEGLRGGTHSSRWNLLVNAIPRKALATTSTKLPDEMLIDFKELDKIISSREAVVMRLVGFLGMIKRFLRKLTSK